MTVWKEEYVIQESLPIIATTAYDEVGNSIANIQTKAKYGSANSLVVTSLASENLIVELDGLSTRRFALMAGLGASLVLEPENGIFFDWVKITNTSATNTSADEINVRMARAVPIKGT